MEVPDDYVVRNMFLEDVDSTVDTLDRTPQAATGGLLSERHGSDMEGNAFHSLSF